MAIPLRKSDYNTTYYRSGGGNGKGKGKGVYIFPAVIVILLIGYFLSDSSYFTHKTIRVYLDERQQLFSSSDSEFKDLLAKLNQHANDVNLLYSDILQVKTSLQNNYLRFQELTPPRHFQALHDYTLEWFKLKNDAIYYLEISSLANTYQNEEFSQYINESNQIGSMLKPSMIEGLQKSKIRYEVEPDGHIVYWVKEDPYRQW